MPDRHGSLAATLETSVLDGAGSVPAEVRRVLAGAGAVPAALAPYAELVRRHASKTTDEDVSALMTAGYTEDQVYEITVSIALGAGLSRLRAGLAALDESLRLAPETGLSHAPEAVADEVSEPEPAPSSDEPFMPTPVVDPDLAPLVRRDAGA